MKALMLSALAGTALLLGTANDAAAGWQRHGFLATPRGTYIGSRAGGCGGGSCWRSRSVTGPYGRTVSGSRSISHTGPGQFSSTGTVTGRDGRTATRTGSTSCGGGSCTRDTTVTGRDGRTYDDARTVTNEGNGTYAGSNTFTGPNGGTVTHSGSTTFGQ